jgi:mannitol/fructose-specific phosphotransferase system IIA component (Ntr-type)
MRIAELLKGPESIVFPLKSNNADDILEELLSKLNLDKKKHNNYLKALKEREKQISTGIGNEVAIPHIRSNKEDKFLFAMGIAKEPIDFKDPTKCKTKVFFLTISPSEQGNAHLALLSHISVICKDAELISKIKNAAGSQEIYNLILEKEKSLKKLKEEIEDSEAVIKKYQLLFIILYKEEYISDILNVFSEFDLRRTSIFEGSELKTFLATSIPIFQGFRDIMREDNKINKLIISVVEEEKTFRIAKMIDNACNGFTNEEDGYIISIPVNLHLGI